MSRKHNLLHKQSYNLLYRNVLQYNLQGKRNALYQVTMRTLHHSDSNQNMDLD